MPQAAVAPTARNLLEAALIVLSIPDIKEKAFLTRLFFRQYRANSFSPVASAFSADAAQDPAEESRTLPSYPARPANLQVVRPGEVAKRGVGGSTERRVAMIHSLAHIESWAIDLSWDVVARWAHLSRDGVLPEEFFADWAEVADDEARHFGLLNDRLSSLGSFYGAMPVHDGLWESASTTFHDLLARLAVEHCVHEGRGLDVTPKTIARFRSAADLQSADMLTVIYNEEIAHVQKGLKWFTYICERRRPRERPVDVFHETVRANFHGKLKPPFNAEARARAGMGPEWYEPLSV